MDYKKMAIYVLAGYGAYALYQSYVEPKFSSLTGTEWQKEGYSNCCGA